MYECFDIVTSLMELTKHDKLHCTSKAKVAFSKFKEASTTTPTMTIANPTQPFDTMIDSFDRASRGVLMQQNRAIVFDNHKFLVVRMCDPIHDKKF